MVAPREAHAHRCSRIVVRSRIEWMAITRGCADYNTTSPALLPRTVAYAKTACMKRLVGWISLWLILFSAMDFWGIRLWQIERAPWFGDYRTAMYEYISWISPASFGLAENAYFIWVNLIDADRQNWEWTFYTGNP